VRLGDTGQGKPIRCHNRRCRAGLYLDISNLLTRLSDILLDSGNILDVSCGVLLGLIELNSKSGDFNANQGNSIISQRDSLSMRNLSELSHGFESRIQEDSLEGYIIEIADAITEMIDEAIAKLLNELK
jgi:hypothetical protein